jgi:hypothetical protein
MYMRAFNIRIVYVGVLSLAAVFGSVLRQHDVQAAPAIQAVQQPAAPSAARQVPVVTLATVRVSHASAKARPAAPPTAQVTDTARFSSGSALPSLRLDMPYYSFGKLLPHVGKE